MIDYTLNFGIGIGKMEFLWNQEEIINYLGPPDEIKKDIYEGLPNEYSIDLIYDSLGIKISYNYYNDIPEKAEFFLEKAIVDTQNLYNLSKKDILKLISKTHLNKNLKFEYSLEKTDLDEFYSFDNIGLSLWFEYDKLTDVSVYYPTDSNLS